MCYIVLTEAANPIVEIYLSGVESLLFICDFVVRTINISTKDSILIDLMIFCSF